MNIDKRYYTIKSSLPVKDKMIIVGVALALLLVFAILFIFFSFLTQSTFQFSKQVVNLFPDIVQRIFYWIGIVIMGIALICLLVRLIRGETSMMLVIGPLGRPMWRISSKFNSDDYPASQRSYHQNRNISVKVKYEIIEEDIQNLTSIYPLPKISIVNFINSLEELQQILKLYGPHDAIPKIMTYTHTLRKVLKIHSD